MNAVATTKPAAHKPKLGRRFIPANACSYPPAVLADDVLLVDLDTDHVTMDGLYLLERLDDAEAVAWMGCRRLEIGLQGVRVDDCGQMVPLPADGALRIAGRVLRVYRPTDLIGSQA